MGRVSDVELPRVHARQELLREDFQQFFKNRVAGPETHADFIDANGGARTIIDIRRRTT
jgi:hypothetical protein